MIPDEVVEQVRDAADIVQIVGEYVNLKRAGQDFRGPCPFHQGTHRNFSVSPRKRMYYCFVCHEGGDVFRFLQKRLGVEWPSAVKMVGEKSGIEVREIDSRREGPDPREPIWEVNATAAAYFQKILWDDPLGEQAREYLEQRDITKETAEQFGIGFAPREIGLLRNYMSTLGFDEQRQIAAGLLVSGEEGSEPRPRFRGRLMFPILDAMGRNVGFGGRLLGPGEPKYLNSPESAAFSKGRTLYGLNWAKNDIRREDHVLVVEGYFDVVRLINAGFTTVVAPMGTALTEQQSQALRKLTKNIFLLYDSDKAGLQATFRSGDELLRQGASVRIVTLPDGEDPDTFVKTHGATALTARMRDAIDVFERKIQLLERAGMFAELHKKRRALDRLFPTIRAASDQIMRDLYLTRASEVSGVAREVLERELTGRATPRVGAADAPAISTATGPRISPAARVRRGERRAQHSERGASAERELIRAMLFNRARVVQIAEKLGAESFRTPSYREIYRALVAAGPESTIEQVSANLDEDAIETIQEFLAEGAVQIDQERTINDSFATLRARDLDLRAAELDRIIPLANGAKKDELIAEKDAIRRELKATGKFYFKKFRHTGTR
ncbi:MAG TPA: DNA primase [Gemmatimonadaceae bacterium]|nr:DNA primase [Gemmatimonadaceae bacterium]